MSERVTPDDANGEAMSAAGPETPTRTDTRAAHRASRPVRAKPGGANLVLPVVLIVVAVAALAIAWGTLQDKQGNSAVTASSGSPTGLTSPTPSATQPSPSSSPTPSPTPSKSASPSKSPSPSASSPSASPTPGATASLADSQKIVVLVRNATTRKGLAAAAGKYLTSVGWKVQDAANWTGAPITKTTIFYPPGKAAEARRLATFVRGDVVIAVATPKLPSDVFVLVMAANYPT